MQYTQPALMVVPPMALPQQGPTTTAATWETVEPRRFVVVGGEDD